MQFRSNVRIYFTKSQADIWNKPPAYVVENPQEININLPWINMYLCQEKKIKINKYKSRCNGQCGHFMLSVFYQVSE